MQEEKLQVAVLTYFKHYALQCMLPTVHVLQDLTFNFPPLIRFCTFSCNLTFNKVPRDVFEYVPFYEPKDDCIPCYLPQIKCAHCMVMHKPITFTDLSHCGSDSKGICHICSVQVSTFRQCKEFDDHYKADYQVFAQKPNTPSFLNLYEVFANLKSEIPDHPTGPSYKIDRNTIPCLVCTLPCNRCSHCNKLHKDLNFLYIIPTTQAACQDCIQLIETTKFCYRRQLAASQKVARLPSVSNVASTPSLITILNQNVDTMTMFRRGVNDYSPSKETIASMMTMLPLKCQNLTCSHLAQASRDVVNTFCHLNLLAKRAALLHSIAVSNSFISTCYYYHFITALQAGIQQQRSKTHQSITQCLVPSQQPALTPLTPPPSLAPQILTPPSSLNPTYASLLSTPPQIVPRQAPTVHQTLYPQIPNPPIDNQEARHSTNCLYSHPHLAE